jgi:hypothetical protein
VGLAALAFYYGSQLVANDLGCVLSGGKDCITGGAIITCFFAFLIGCGDQDDDDDACRIIIASPFTWERCTSALLV